MSYRTIRSIIEGQEIITCAASTLVIDAARLMEQRRVGAVLIVDEGKLVGIFTERDALIRVIAKGRDAQTTRLDEVMTRNPKTADPDKPFGYALRMMYEESFRHVPIVENDRPVGMVSARDALGPELEDFVYELLQREQIEQVLA